MIKVNDGVLYQWDTNRTLTIKDLDFDEVHFENAVIDKAIKTTPQDENAVVIPNELLQSPIDIFVYAVKNGKVIGFKNFTVVARKKPADYIYTPTEIETFETLKKNISEVLTEAKKYTDDAVKNFDVSDINIKIDEVMSVTSTNPVQNKVVTEHIAGVVQGFTDWSVQVHEELKQEVYENIGSAINNQLPSLFVVKENGKGLSTNDFTNDYKSKVDNAVTQPYMEEYVDSVIGGIENGSY